MGDSTRSGRRPVRLRVRVALFAITVLVALALGELLLRLVGSHHPVPMERHRERGFAYRPGLVFDYDAEGRSSVRINEHGFRERAWSTPKPPGALRVVVVGDSYTDAIQVEAEERFTSIAEEELRAACPSRPVEVLNLGTSGYGTAQELLVLEGLGWDLRPDVVVVAVCTGNDVRNNSRELDGDPTKPYYELRDGALWLDTSFRDRSAPLGKRIGQALARGSRLGQLAYRMRQLAHHRRRAARERDAGTLEVGLSNQVYRAPRDAAWTRAWEITEGIFQAMADSARARDTGLLIMTLSNAIQVHPDAAVRAAAARSMEVEDLFHADRRFAEIGERVGAEVLTLAPTLADVALEQEVFFHGFPGTVLGHGHWNEAGHRLAGEALARRLERMLPACETGP